MSPHAQNFFLNNKLTLEKNYPGINLNIFESFLSDVDEYVLSLEKKLLEGIPFAYILNESFFYKNSFYIDQDVLVPRFETEILVERSIDLVKERTYKTILDLGCGSGCIGLSIALDSRDLDQVDFSDISEIAIKCTRTNYNKLSYGLNKTLGTKFYLGDRRIDSNYDLIVSNPPYIKRSIDRHLVHEKVNAFEPDLALYIDDDKYTYWFNELCLKAYEKLNPKGCLFLEGHEDHLKNLIEVFERNKFVDIEIIQDYTNRDRFIRGFKNG